MVAVNMRVDDVFDRHVGKRSDRRHDFGGHLSILGVDHQDTILADLQSRVAARAHKHVDVALDREDLFLHVVEVLFWARSAPTQTVTAESLFIAKGVTLQLNNVVQVQ